MPHHASAFGCGNDVVKDFFHDNVHKNCGETTNLNGQVQKLASDFLVNPNYFPTLLGGVENPFKGDVWGDYGFAPPTNQGESGARAYCAKALDYCVFLNFDGERTSCPCMQDYGACLAASGAVPDPSGFCSLYMNAYGNALGYTAFVIGGSCSSFCAKGVSVGFATAHSSGITTMSLSPFSMLFGLVILLGVLG